MHYRLRSANILLITFKALANEIAKNLVLAGIGSLTILDHEVVTETDLCAQFFVSEEHVGQNVRSRSSVFEYSENDTDSSDSEPKLQPLRSEL